MRPSHLKRTEVTQQHHPTIFQASVTLGFARIICVLFRSETKRFQIELFYVLFLKYVPIAGYQMINPHNWLGATVCAPLYLSSPKSCSERDTEKSSFWALQGLLWKNILSRLRLYKLNTRSVSLLVAVFIILIIFRCL